MFSVTYKVNKDSNVVIQIVLTRTVPSDKDSRCYRCVRRRVERDMQITRLETLLWSRGKSTIITTSVMR